LKGVKLIFCSYLSDGLETGPSRHSAIAWVRVALCLGIATGAWILSREGEARPPTSHNELCIILTSPPWVRADIVSYVILHTEAESLAATTWRPRTVQLPTARGDSSFLPASRVVYGQRVQIRRAVGFADAALGKLGLRDSVALVRGEWIACAAGSLPLRRLS
jgi:hypothetical protein